MIYWIMCVPIRLVEGIKGDMLNDEGAGTHGRGNENCPNQVARSGRYRSSSRLLVDGWGVHAGEGFTALFPDGWHDITLEVSWEPTGPGCIGLFVKA